MDTLLTAKNIYKKYVVGGKDFYAIHNVSLSIMKGSSISITGPSGCGKTTLLNLLGLISEPDQGEIFLNGKNTSKLTRKERLRLRNQCFGYVVQNFALIDDYTVLQNVEIPLLYSVQRFSKKMRRQKVLEVLQGVGLEKRIGEKVHNLSGGERQRIAVARALVNNADIILADEPTGSLDSESGEKVFALLQGAVNKGKTLIMVTHNSELAGRCEHQIKMLDGVIQG